MFYSFETEYNTPEGRCDFLAIPKPGFAKPARLIEFKYFTAADCRRRQVKDGGQGQDCGPDAETVEQALRYREALRRRPDWSAPIETTVVEVYCDRGYAWFDLE